MLAKTRSTLKTALGIGLATLLVAGCAPGAGGGGGGQASSSAQAGAGGAGGTQTGQPDTQAPTFAADAASAANTFHTVATGGTITLSGTADDNVGVAQVTVNGTPATLGGTPQASTWQAQVPVRPGVNVIEVEASDAAGNQKTGWWSVFCAETYLNPQDAVQGAGYVYITQSGFQAFSQIVNGYFNQNNPLALALVNQALNIPINANLGFAGISAQVTQATFDPPTVTLTPTASGLAGVVTVPNLSMAVAAGALGSFTFHADRVVVQSTVRVDVSQGQYQVTMSQTQAQVVNPSVAGVNAASSVAAIILNAAAPIVASQASTIIAQNVQTLLPPAITRALNSLSPTYQQTVLGVTFTASAQPQSIGYSTRGIEIAFEANLTSNQQVHPNAPGSLGFTASGAPTYGQGQHVSAAVSSAMVNRALYSAWDAGLMDYTIDQQFLTQFGIHLPFQISNLLPMVALIFPSLQAMGTPRDIALQLAFDLPPSADFSGQAPNLRFAAGGLRASLAVDFGAGYVPVLSLNMAGELGANLQTSAQAIQLSLQAPTQVRFDITQNGNPLNLNLQSVNTFVNMAIGQAVQLLGSFIPAIPMQALPAFQGVQLGFQTLDTTFEPRFVVIDATLR